MLKAIATFMICCIIADKELSPIVKVASLLLFLSIKFKK